MRFPVTLLPVAPAGREAAEEAHPPAQLKAGGARVPPVAVQCGRVDVGGHPDLGGGPHAVADAGRRPVQGVAQVGHGIRPVRARAGARGVPVNEEGIRRGA